MAISNVNPLSAELADPRIRIPLVTLLAFLAWLGILVIFGYLLNQSAPPQSTPASVAIQLIDAPANGLAGGGGGAPAASVIKPAPHAAMRKIVTAPVHRAPLPSVRPRKRFIFHKPKAAESSEIPVHHAAPITQPASVPDVTSRDSAAISSGYPSARVGGSKTTAADAGAGIGHGTGSGSGASSGSGSGTGGGFGTGGSGPHAIYAPVPSIPDDLRDEVMEATAVVRFHVSRDGSASVALVRSTDYSELDELILDTLRQWRFAPAVRNGIKVDSDAELRLLVSVQ